MHHTSIEVEKIRYSRGLLASAAALCLYLASPHAQSIDRPAPSPFVVDEATIASVHAAMSSGAITCRALVGQYLARINAYDKKGPALDAIVTLNRDAEEQAEALDVRFKASGRFVGPLHCVPVIVKDNLETIGMESSAGSLALRRFKSTRDATVIRRMRAAGAIVLAKSNMAEFALDSLATVSSLGGTTRNPYALDRVPAGSSGGTAAAIAANFALVGIGTDTGSSIRGPASHADLVGLRPTMGLTSRTGMIPLNVLSDVPGPMTRTVEDAAAVLDVIAGEDLDDPVTLDAPELADYARALTPDALKGARVGVLLQAYDWSKGQVDDEVVTVFARALQDLADAGAEVIESVQVDDVKPAPGAEQCRGFAYDLNEYLAKRGASVPMHSLDEILESEDFHPSILNDLLDARAHDEQGPDSKACKANAAYRKAVAESLTKTMDALDLDVLVYPTWGQPPQLVKSINPQRAGAPVMFATTSGFPAITVPMGFTRGDLPAGLSMLGRAWSEETLLRLAYAYEQATKHRRPPATTPTLR